MSDMSRPGEFGRNGIGKSTARAIGNVLSPRGVRGRLVVFCFHQVLEKPDPLRPGEPTELEFARDVEVIDRTFSTLPFGEAVKGLESGTLPRRAACITFDDGYANNSELAAPILESAGVPATFFIAGGAIDAGIMWNDLVIESFARSAANVSIQELQAKLGDLKYRPVAERWGAAEQIFREAVGGAFPRLMMTREMVADLSDRGFEIGGHTINHPILKEQSDEDANLEIAGCVEWIRNVTGIIPTTFAYPNGIPGQDFSRNHEHMVRDAGFEAAASTQWSVAGPKANRFSIPRVGPWWRQGRGLATGLARSYLKSYLNP